MKLLGDPQQRDRDLRAELDRWVDARLLTVEQSASIVDFEGRRRIVSTAAATPVADVGRPRRVAPVAEALGYLGGILATVGLVLLLRRYWPELEPFSRVALAAGSSLALLVAGWIVPENGDPALARLRGFLWTASTAAAALLTFVVIHDWLATYGGSTITFACASTVALEGALLWRGRTRPMQQLAFLGGTVVAAGAATAIFASGGWVGLAVWSIGAAYLLGGLSRMTTVPLQTEAVGLVGLIVGAMTTASAWQSFGLPFAAATALALLGLAVAPGSMTSVSDRRLCAVVGGLAFVSIVPGTIGYFSREAGVATGATVWGLGAILLYLGASARARVPVVVEAAGGIALLGGAALSATQWPGLAPVLGLITAGALVALGMLPGRVLLSLLGSLGLLINVPWLIAWFFPGDGRAPLLILISGSLILALAVFLSRQRNRFRRELAAVDKGALD